MLETLKEFCCKEVTKSVPKYLKCAVDSFKTTKIVESRCPFELDRIEFAQVFAHSFLTNLVFCILKIFISFAIVTPLAVVTFSPPPIIHPIIAVGSYRLSSKVVDNLFL